MLYGGGSDGDKQEVVTMNWKHLLWIVPLALVFGLLLGAYVTEGAENVCMESLLGQTIYAASMERAVDACVTGEITKECYQSVYQAEHQRLTKVIE